MDTKLTYRYILSHLDKISCPCLVEPCMPCKGKDLLPYLSSLGYKTNKDTLNHIIQVLTTWYGTHHYADVYYDDRKALYEGALVRDVCKVYQAFSLGKSQFEKLVNG